MAPDGDAPKPRDVEHGDGQVVAKTEAPIGAVVAPTHFAQPRQARTPGTPRTRRKRPKRARETTTNRLGHADPELGGNFDSFALPRQSAKREGGPVGQMHSRPARAGIR